MWSEVAQTIVFCGLCSSGPSRLHAASLRRVRFVVMRALLLVTVIVLLSAAVFAQPESTRKFDVASVKPIPESQVARQPGERGSGRGCPAGIRVNPAHIEFRCSTLLQLIGYAFRIS